MTNEREPKQSCCETAPRASCGCAPRQEREAAVSKGCCCGDDCRCGPACACPAGCGCG